MVGQIENTPRPMTVGRMSMYAQKASPLRSRERRPREERLAPPAATPPGGTVINSLPLLLGEDLVHVLSDTLRDHVDGLLERPCLRELLFGEGRPLGGVQRRGVRRPDLEPVHEALQIEVRVRLDPRLGGALVR